MDKYQNFTSLYLRIALGATMLSAVADRFGIWGAPGEPGIAWGDWETFVAYTADLNAFVPAAIIPFLAFAATALEIAFGILLIIGLKTRAAAFGTGCLLTMFALAMAIAYGVKSPFDYSVFIGSAAGFFLAGMPYSEYSIDKLLKNTGNTPANSHGFENA